MAERLPQEAALGHQGWTCMPRFNSVWWWTLVSSLMLGVGIGALAQPQLAVRFMTVKSSRELNRAVLIGSVFILFTVGSAYMVGALSNVFFYYTGHGIADGIQGKLSIEAADGNPDLIIPMFIREALPPVILYLFSLTLLSAAMSTLSSLFHVTGSAIGHDLFRNLTKKQGDSTLITRLGVVFGIAVSVILGIVLPPGHHRARHRDLFRRLRGVVPALLRGGTLLARHDAGGSLGEHFGRRRREPFRALFPAPQGVGGAGALPGAVRKVRADRHVSVALCGHVRLFAAAVAGGAAGRQPPDREAARTAPEPLFQII